MELKSQRTYRGRLAPSPTGFLHLGHARTFWIAAQRAQRAGGGLILRNDDLDRDRCRPEYVEAMQEDLRWLGLAWTGAMISQSERIDRYRSALRLLHQAGLIYPCTKSRRDVIAAAGAPHDEDEPIYPVHFRPPPGASLASVDAPDVNWRFRVTDGQSIQFEDGRLGLRQAVCGVDFGDFLVWRRDNLPSYQLACVIDDFDFAITEVVRGEDLVLSTFRQILLQRALSYPPTDYFHCPLMSDSNGHRLAKRHDSLSLRSLRKSGVTADSICSAWANEGT